MKKLLITVFCLVVISSKRHFSSKFLGKWTDGTLRHIAITADNNGYLVEDISGGDKIYRATIINNNEMIVDIKHVVSTFNYIRETDELFAGPVLFHRESKAK